MPYRNALLAEPSRPNKSNTDPRILSELDCKARQILVDIYNTEGNDTMAKSLTDLVGKANEAIASIDNADKPKDAKVLSALKSHKNAVLLTLNSKEAADWFKDPMVEEAFTRMFSEGSHIREKAYNIIVPRVPTTFEPNDEKHLCEVEEVNGLDKKVLTRAKWIKPVGRRRQDQTHAYAIFSFTSVDAANTLIRDGIIVCGTRMRPKKQKREPVQCMKCRLWGHFASECMAEADTCGTCSEGHRTNQCKNKDKMHCASCRPNTHASWDRNCPEFIRRCAILDERNPQNAMPYFPTEHDWTLTVRPERIPLDERFPGKYAINSLPSTGNRNLVQASRPKVMQPPKGPAQRRGLPGKFNQENPNLIPIEQGREEGELPAEEATWMLEPAGGSEYMSIEDEYTPDRIKGWD